MHVAAVNNADGQLVAVQKSHTDQREGVSRVDGNAASGTVPDEGAFENIAHTLAPVCEQAPASAAPGKPQCGNG